MLRRTTHQLEIPAGATIPGLWAAIPASGEQAQPILKPPPAFIAGQQAERAADRGDGPEVIFMRLIAGASSEVQPLLR